MPATRIRDPFAHRTFPGPGFVFCMTMPIEELEPHLSTLRRQFASLVEPHRSGLWRFCLKLTGSAWDAEDLSQDTLLKTFGQLAMLARADNPRAYLFRTASNLWIDTVRRRRTTADLEDAGEVAAPVDVAAADVDAAMAAVVTALPPRQRAIFLLVDAFAFKPREAADMLKMTEGAVKAALHRARATLQKTGGDAPAETANVDQRARRALVERYVDALNRRDPDALVALFDPVAINEVIGAGELFGVEALRMTLGRWAATSQSQWAEIGTLDGRDVAFLFAPADGAPRTLVSVVDFVIDGERLVAQRWYLFCPELLAYAADRLGVAAGNFGYGG
jgi:RNA polymerase sigma factor (sigma-70 family)